MSHGDLDVLERQLEARDPDVRLMLQVRDDISGAFETLVQRYQDRLVGILYHLVGSLEEAEDLSQDVFLRIYKARKGYRPRAKFSTWLFTIANNLALIAGLVRFQARKMPQDSLLPAQDVRAWLQQISLRIDTVGRLHRLLTDNDGQATVDLFTYLREIADAALLALSMDGQTEILIDLEPNCVIPAKQASAVGLAVGDRTRLNMLTRPEYRERLVLHRGMAETVAWSLKWQTTG